MVESIIFNIMELRFPINLLRVYIILGKYAICMSIYTYDNAFISKFIIAKCFKKKKQTYRSAFIVIRFYIYSRQFEFSFRYYTDHFIGCGVSENELET